MDPSVADQFCFFSFKANRSQWKKAPIVSNREFGWVFNSFQLVSVITKQNMVDVVGGSIKNKLFSIFDVFACTAPNYIVICTDDNGSWLSVQGNRIGLNSRRKSSTRTYKIIIFNQKKQDDKAFSYLNFVTFTYQKTDQTGLSDHWKDFHLSLDICNTSLEMWFFLAIQIWVFRYKQVESN